MLAKKKKRRKPLTRPTHIQRLEAQIAKLDHLRNVTLLERVVKLRLQLRCFQATRDGTLASLVELLGQATPTPKTTSPKLSPKPKIAVTATIKPKPSGQLVTKVPKAAKVLTIVKPSRAVPRTCHAPGCSKPCPSGLKCCGPACGRIMKQIGQEKGVATRARKHREAKANKLPNEDREDDSQDDERDEPDHDRGETDEVDRLRSHKAQERELLIAARVAGRKPRSGCCVCGLDTTETCRYGLSGKKEGQVCGKLMCKTHVVKVGGETLCQAHATVQRFLNGTPP